MAANDDPTGRHRAGRRNGRPGRRGGGAALLLPPILAACAAGATAAAVIAPAVANTPSVEELRSLSIEDLANVEITSVSRRPEPLSQAPAAVYVITAEDIRRSGATSLPEALRLAPNLEVARRNPQTYAISARGFNSVEAANKLLVLIDGRSIYSPLFGGVEWDQQQVMLADVERIEVISGPGGTLYGANAVNGVINVITKSARDTQGGLVDLKAGTVDQSGAARFGGKFGENGAYRAYAMAFGRGHSDLPDGTNARDGFQGKQTGFRTDWSTGKAGFTVQGDLYDNETDGGGELFNGTPVGGQIFGGNLLGRWTQQLTGGSRLELQSYVSRDHRFAPSVTEVEDTFDIQLQHVFALGDRNEVVWGLGNRVNRDKFINNANFFVFDPPVETYDLGNVFLQDTYALRDDLKLTLGTKFEYNTFSGFEYLPSARLAWQISDAHLLWSAVSRAVRTPTPIDRNLVAPGLFIGGPDFQSEKVIAYEVGYRGRPATDLTFSLSLYYNRYEDIRTTEFSPSGGLPLRFGNALKGDGYGVEAWGEYRPLSWWRLSPGVNFLHKNLSLKQGVVDLSNGQSTGSDPAYQLSLHSYMDLPGGLELDVGVRTVDDLQNPAIPSYTQVDARLGWRVADGIELSLSAFDLFDSRHAETAASSGPPRELRRTIYVGLRSSF
ncbi:MAG TPA: TonB-dependent receptor [Stellaceae bacterium]